MGGWFLGDVPGTNTLTASTPNVAAVTFTAIGDPGRAVSMVANSATAQSAAAGADVADPPSVVVRDLAGNPVAGVAVTFAVTAGGGAVVGSPVTTNASGVATVTFMLALLMVSGVRYRTFKDLKLSKKSVTIILGA